MKIMMSSLCGRVLFNEQLLGVMEGSLVSMATLSINNQDGLLCREASSIVRVQFILILLAKTKVICNYLDFKYGEMCALEE